MQMNQFSRILIMALLFIVTYILGSFLYLRNEIETLQHNKYLQTSKDMKGEFRNFVKNKSDSTLLIALSLSANESILGAVEHNNYKGVNFKKLTNVLNSSFIFSNIWFHIVKSDGTSFYKSWTDKRGENILNIRKDIKKILRKPKVFSTISVGKYDMTFKAMVPMFDNKKFIGIVEVITKFYSIAKKMKICNNDLLIVVDKSYKKQLTIPYTKIFVGDYYIAYASKNRKLLNLVQKSSIEKYLKIPTYIIDTKNSLLITTVHLSDVDGKPMAYAIIAKDLKNIDFSGVEQAKKSTLEMITLILLLIIIFFYYLYYANYKYYMTKQKKLLELAVDRKTKELKEQKDVLAFIAHYDNLTKLPNKNLLLDKIEEAIKSTQKNRKKFSVLSLGLDKFKEVNDTYGYEIGDMLLLEVASRLKEHIKGDDVLARFSGDKFVILHRNSTEKDTAELANKILIHTKKVFNIKNIDIFTTFSVGIVFCCEDLYEADQLLILAETAMYKAKDNGKNNYQFYNKMMTELISKKIELDRDIKNALQNEEFVVYFQPKVDARDGHVIGLEALIRWIHPEKGVIPPGDFIPFCEETGLVSEIDKYMLIKSMQQMQKWREEKIEFGKVSVNVSAKKIESLNYIDELSSIIKDLQFDTSLLELEILEGQTMKDAAKSIEILNAIRSLGISISIDDFGTGYSSLSYLKKLPVNKIKIDRSFIMDIPNNKKNEAIVKTIINLAENLNLELIAEGVETKEQLDFLVVNGCYNIQGYYFSKPLTVDAYKEFIVANSKSLVKRNPNFQR